MAQEQAPPAEVVKHPSAKPRPLFPLCFEVKTRTKHAHHLLLAMAEHASRNDPICRAGVRRLRTACGMSSATYYRALAELNDAISRSEPFRKGGHEHTISSYAPQSEIDGWARCDCGAVHGATHDGESVELDDDGRWWLGCPLTALHEPDELSGQPRDGIVFDHNGEPYPVVAPDEACTLLEESECCLCAVRLEFGPPRKPTTRVRESIMSKLTESERWQAALADAERAGVKPRPVKLDELPPEVRDALCGRHEGCLLHEVRPAS